MIAPALVQLTPRLSIDLATLIGKGSTGNVYLGHCLDPHPHQVAIKRIPLEEINNEVVSYLLQCELEALKATSQIQNSSIVRLEEIIVADNHCHIAMELLSGGTLKDYLGKFKRLEEERATHIIKNILEGYKILKSNHIVHRDLKPDNIIFASLNNQNHPNGHEPLEPKIIDFGYCEIDKLAHLKPKMFYNVGSPRYMSPEAYTGNQYSERSDVWAIGVIFYQMLTGTNFDKGKSSAETFRQIREKGIPIPASLGTLSRRIMQGMLMFDVKKRWTCDQVLEEIYNSGERQASDRQHNQVPQNQQQPHQNRKQQNQQRIPPLNSSIQQQQQQQQPSPFNKNMNLRATQDQNRIQTLRSMSIGRHNSQQADKNQLLQSVSTIPQSRMYAMPVSPQKNQQQRNLSVPRNNPNPNPKNNNEIFYNPPNAPLRNRQQILINNNSGGIMFRNSMPMKAQLRTPAQPQQQPNNIYPSTPNKSLLRSFDQNSSQKSTTIKSLTNCASEHNMKVMNASESRPGPNQQGRGFNAFNQSQNRRRRSSNGVNEIFRSMNGEPQQQQAVFQHPQEKDPRNTAMIVQQIVQQMHPHIIRMNAKQNDQIREQDNYAIDERMFLSVNPRPGPPENQKKENQENHFTAAGILISPATPRSNLQSSGHRKPNLHWQQEQRQREQQMNQNRNQRVMTTHQPNNSIPNNIVFHGSQMAPHQIEQFHPAFQPLQSPHPQEQSIFKSIHHSGQAPTINVFQSQPPMFQVRKSQILIQSQTPQSHRPEIHFGPLHR